MSTPELRSLPGGAIEVILPSPILSTGLLRGLTATLNGLASQAAPIVLSSAHPAIFLAGADLAEIASLDMGSSLPYARLGRRLMERIRSFPAPLVAAVHGSCAGGGLDLVLACDAISASPRAAFAHPGVHRGLVTGWGGTDAFPVSGGAGPARRLFLEGAFLAAEEAFAAGWVSGIDADPVDAARREALRLSRLARPRLELWRRLRHVSFVDRSRASVVHNCWRLFRMETGART